jgi:poly(beta-D-mannuronate) lyase
VDSDGYLPLELQRRSKARHYHLFALKPLILIAELTFGDGLNLYEAEGGAIRRLARRCLIGIADPSGFVDRAGADQEYFQRDALTGGDIAWLEPFEARFPAPDQADLLARHRPVRDRRLGGDMTRRFSPLASPPAATSN